jgi:hypothetical protein
MPEHGDYNEELRRWYCSYWITAEEWEDIHDYAPSSFLDLATDKKTSNDHKRSHTHTHGQQELTEAAKTNNS